MVQLTGLTQEQVELCDIIWGLETQEEIQSWFLTLTARQAREASNMFEMITLQLIDDIPNEELDLTVARELIDCAIGKA